MGCWKAVKAWLQRAWSSTTPPRREDVVNLGHLNEPLIDPTDDGKRWWSEVDQDSVALCEQALTFEVSSSASSTDNFETNEGEVDSHYSNFLLRDSVIAQRIGNGGCEIIQRGDNETRNVRTFGSLDDHSDGFGNQESQSRYPKEAGAGEQSTGGSLYYSTVIQGAGIAGTERDHVKKADRGPQQAEQEP